MSNLFESVVVGLLGVMLLFLYDIKKSVRKEKCLHRNRKELFVSHEDSYVQYECLDCHRVFYRGLYE